MVSGPWAYAIDLDVVIDSHGERANERATDIVLRHGDLVNIDGVVYLLAFDREQIRFELVEDFFYEVRS